LILVAAVGVLALAGCGVHNERAGVGIDGAMPEAVVTADVAAVGGGDVARARRLMTEHFAKRVEGAVDSWFTNTNSITDLRVGMTRPEQGNSSDGVKYFRAVYVPVDFVIDVKGEESIEDGPMTWGYILVKRDRDAPWLIDQDGVG
jgi:hypothetical protein